MNPTALIVDDSLTVRMDLAHAFEAAGFRPVLCPTAAEARAAVGSTPFDVIILDVVLPDADGLELLGELRRHPDASGAAILMLSSEAEVKDRILGMETGADEYVGKPYDTGYVIAKSRELLRAKGVRETRTTTVLLIDDSAAVRQELAGALDAEGYTAITAETGEEGLRIAADRRPDAVIVDGILPGIDGPTVIRRLRLDGALRGAPCLLLTAAEDHAAELQALDAGADAFVHKGDPAVILAKLAAALRTTAGAAVGEDAHSLLGPKKLLVVDDDPAHLDALRDDGFDLVATRSGADAVALLAHQPVDCVLLDARTAGLEACQRIKAGATTRSVPVIVTIDRADATATVDGLAAGADDVIPRGSDAAILKARIRSHIRRKQFEDHNRRIRDELLSRELAATEARAAQEVAEARAALTGELERRNEELESFSYSVSHDLRSPLTGLISLNEMLLDDPGLDGGVRECVESTLRAARRMAELINDLLQLSHVSGSELAREPVDLSEIARSTVEDLRRREPARSVVATVEDGVTALADARLVRVLLENLLGNAWKYSSKRAEPVVEFGRRSDCPAAFFVRDNGAGFDMALADRLFRPFARLHSQDQFPGTGIGLATVRRVVDRHGGRIWTEAAVGAGATFSFTLPEPA